MRPSALVFSSLSLRLSYGRELGGGGGQFFPPSDIKCETIVLVVNMLQEEPLAAAGLLKGVDGSGRALATHAHLLACEGHRLAPPVGQPLPLQDEST